MSTRRMSTPLGEASFDHGAQYFTVRDPAFIARVALWAEAGQVAPWPPAGDDAWVGMPSMNTPIRAMADECDVRWSIGDGLALGKVPAVSGQAIKIIKRPLRVDPALGQESPCPA
jgi:hypothetical protein